MFHRVMSAALLGIEAVPVYVEADVSDGLPVFSMVGSLGLRVREAQDRVRTALKNEGFALPPKRITINLAPADISKDGSRFDLAIALAVLMSQAVFPPEALEGVMVVGELSLGGRVNGIPGVLNTVMAAKKAGCRLCLVPEDNQAEAGLVAGMPVLGVGSLAGAIAAARRHFDGAPVHKRIRPVSLPAGGEDFADIRGQSLVKRAALLAAAGFHNLLMTGPPGSGKTMAARRLPGIMPPMTDDECLELTQIYSAAGELGEDGSVIAARPFRAPHHTVTVKTLTGGGRLPRPGEITLAHRGILFLDEMPEFSRAALEALRQPLENREIVISRTTGTFRFPANFLLAAAVNPCPCGQYGQPGGQCTCSPAAIARYRERLSGPLMDRIDLKVVVPPVTYRELTDTAPSDVSSAVLRAAVLEAHRRQKERYHGEAFDFNSGIPAGRLAEYCPLTPAAARVLEAVFVREKLSARAYHRLLRVARTAADLDGAAEIDRRHIEEAALYRMAFKGPEE